jgi:hypothetical protein
VIWPGRLVWPLVAVGIPIQVWIDRGTLFGLVAAFTFVPMMLFGVFAREWLSPTAPTGPRIHAPVGPLPIFAVHERDTTSSRSITLPMAASAAWRRRFAECCSSTFSLFSIVIEQLLV